MTFPARVTNITYEKILPRIIDVILNDNFVTYRFIGNGKKWSGVTYNKVVQVYESTLTSSFSGLDNLPSRTEEDLTRELKYDLRAVSHSLTVTGMEKLVNGDSEVQAVNLVKSKMEIAKNGMLNKIGDMAYADGTGNSDKDFLGFNALTDDGTTVDEIAGLSRSTYTQLQSTVTAASAGAISLAGISTLLTATSNGSNVRRKPTIMHTTETVFDLVETLLHPNIRMNYEVSGRPVVTRNSKRPVRGGDLTAYSGFESIVHRTVPLIADEKCPSGKLWATNENFTYWVGKKDPDMKQVEYSGGSAVDSVYADMPSKNTGLQFSGLRDFETQYGEFGYFYLFGNLITEHPGANGVITGITTT